MARYEENFKQIITGKEVAELRKDNARLKVELEILKSHSHILSENLNSLVQFTEKASIASYG